MEMEVGNDVLRDVSLPCELEVSHLGLHNDFFVLFAIDSTRINSLQDFNCASDALLELFECCLGVVKGGDIGRAETGDGELGRVGT
jgi:hypothetical protein